MGGGLPKMSQHPGHKLTTKNKGIAMGGGSPEMTPPADLEWSASGYWSAENGSTAMGGGHVEGIAIGDDIEGSTASSSTGIAGSYWPTETGGTAMGGDDAEGIAIGDDNEDSTAASSGEEQWLNAQQCLDARITPEMRADPLFEEKLLAHQTRTCRPCIYFYMKLDSCRKGISCDHCHICSPEEAKVQKRVNKKEARAEAKMSADGPKPRRRLKSAPSSWVQAIERGLRGEHGDQSGQEDESLESMDPESWGGIDSVKPRILELLENTTHHIDTSHPKRWVCEACNETVLIAQNRNLVAFLTRQCQPGPPPWMHPSHTYTRDVGKIMCGVCFGFSNGLRSAPRLKKPCPGICEPGILHHSPHFVPPSQGPQQEHQK